MVTSAIRTIIENFPSRYRTNSESFGMIVPAKNEPNRICKSYTLPIYNLSTLIPKCFHFNNIMAFAHPEFLSGLFSMT